MNGNRPGKPPKPPLKAPNGDIQLGVADFFNPSNRTASQKGADEQRAGEAHAKLVAEDRAAQAERDAAAAAKRRPPGRPRLTSGISSRGDHPSLGEEDTKRKKRKLSHRRKPKSNWWHPAIIMPILEAVAQPGYAGGYR
jgi:hypothetical protein